jgi:TonB family protein
MNFIYSYLLESSLSIILLYAVFWLFLKKETFFTINRFYLAGSIFFSLLFPVFKWNLKLTDTNAGYVFLLDTVTITPEKLEAIIVPHLSTIRIITIVYLTGAALFLLRFVFQVFQVLRLAARFRIMHRHGVRLVFINRNYQPFSFFRLVFVPESLRETDALPQIIEHEKVHVVQNHSIDLILLEILTIVQWFNPVIWLYSRSLKSIHEYLADEGVVVKGFDKLGYQELLLGQTLGIQVNDLTNNFNHSLLKNRIIMMTKRRSGNFSGWKAALAIPIALGLILIFAVTVNSGSANEGNRSELMVSASGKPIPVEFQEYLSPRKDTLVKASGKEPVYDVVKTMPEFNGGFNALVDFLVTNIKYPEEAKKNNITGTVFVSFVVEKDGKISNTAIMKSANPLLDEEALRVVNAMPKWKPGLNDEGKEVNVKYVLPVKFSLEADKTEKTP